MMNRNILILVVLLLILAACAPGVDQMDAQPTDENTQTDATSTQDRTGNNSVYETAEQTQLVINPSGVPDYPIVFQSRDYGTQIVFWDPDSGNYEYRSLRLSNEDEDEILSYYITIDQEGDIWVRWNHDGRNSATSGMPVEIKTNGEILYSENSPFGDYRVSTLTGDTIFGVVENEDRTYSIVEFNLGDCTYGNVLFVEPTFVYEVMQSSRGYLAIWLMADISIEGGIQILSPDGEQLAFIPGGEFPTWSHDGTRLAYSCYQSSEECFSRQVWLFDLATSSTERLFYLAHGFDSVSWSPDDSQIILGNVNGLSIYEFNGQPRVIFTADSGSPVWR
jgi:hypothetical protein